MALSTSDNPNQSKPAAAKDAKPEAPKDSAKAGPERADEYKEDTELLNAAAASGDADVQNLLGERVIAQQNDDRDALKDIDDRLRAGLDRK